MAVLLVCATFPLIWVGGLVTTYSAGMSVPDWPTTFGYNLFLYPWQTWLLGPWDLFIEHGHRLLGAFVGLLTIALNITVWRNDRRVWMRYVSLAALVAVIVQGVLGGARVIQNDILLARIHGCFGPAFFGLCVAIAVLTSARWRDRSTVKTHPQAGKLHRLAAITVFLSYVQLVIGAHLRHLPVDLHPETFRVTVFFHLLMAAILFVHILLLTIRVLRHHDGEKSLCFPALGLGALMALQLVLGPATWVVKYSWPAMLSGFDFAAGFTVQADSYVQAMLVTAHVATGSLVFVTGVMLALRSFRLARSDSYKRQPQGILLGVLA